MRFWPGIPGQNLPWDAMPSYRRIRYFMAAPFEIIACGPADLCGRGIEAAFREIDRIDRLISIFRPDSAISCLNLGGRTPLPELLDLISSAIDFSKKSEGAFDLTAGPLVDLWGFGHLGERRAAPSQEELVSALRLVGFWNIEIGKGEIHLKKKGMKLNLGAIGKGYAIDRAVALLKGQGISSGRVSCGSTIFCLGDSMEMKGWPVRIQHPREEKDAVGEVVLRDCAMATSGDYEKFFDDRGRRVSHLIDPRSGDPVSGMASVSVIAPTAMAADALSTAAFVLKAREGRRFLQSFPGVAGLMISEEVHRALVVHPTAGWSRHAYLPERRRFLAKAAAFVVAMLVPSRAQATVVYLTGQEAVAKMIPQADSIEEEQVELSDLQLHEAEALAGRRFVERNFRFHLGYKEGEVIGYALTLEVIGKARPITFLIGVDPAGVILGMEVLIYRESEGSEIRHVGFMRQFMNKRKEDPLQLGRDIQAVSGATLSSRAAAYAAKKALSIFEVVYQRGVAPLAGGGH